MDIIDIILAKAMSTPADVQQLVEQAQQAMKDAQDIIDKVGAIEDGALEASEIAKEAAEKATEIADKLDQIVEDITEATKSIVDEEIQEALEEVKNEIQALEEKLIDISITDINTSAVKGVEIQITKKGKTTKHQIKNYTSDGNNEDGSMTQKAIKKYVDDTKAYLEKKIDEFEPGEGGSSGSGERIDLGAENKGKMVVVADDGYIEPSTVSQEELIRMQVLLGVYKVPNSVGLEIDYVNKSCSRIQEAVGLTPGTDFNKYEMFGGRRRCVVDDSGKIVAFYGEMGYNESGFAGQVMVYQPKFYYMRIPVETTATPYGTAMLKEQIIISTDKHSGFEVHPLFLDVNGKEVEYALLSAYEGCAYRTSTRDYVYNDAQDIDFTRDYLSSIAGVKPISGVNQDFNVSNASQMASNRGEGWQLTNMAFESVNQLLMMIEYGSLNLQSAFDKGLTEFANQYGVNTASITGSTYELGSASGRATSTENDVNGIRTTYRDEGKCAISYRGLENPYGNISRFVGGVEVEGNGEANGGTLVINGRKMAFSLPNRSNWISSFGYDPEFKWAMVPITIDNSANSNIPVGDYCHVSGSLNKINCCVAGARNSAKENAGVFYYGMDSEYNVHAHSYSARIMYVPTANTMIHEDNYLKWLED